MPATLEHDPRTSPARAAGGATAHDDASGWHMEASNALDAARMRHAFRDYLLAYGHPASDVDAAEAIFGELIANCAHHAPGRVRAEFSWHDSTLSVTDDSDRLRTWPFSTHDPGAEITHHTYSILCALTSRVLLGRHPQGGTRASVVLPVLPDSR